ncbi:MAG TPA: glycosyltransferase [Solirubrobacteraceae bacterium]|nr:glycosyltransferase [Solirubrobacteraceae bacterium]
MLLVSLGATGGLRDADAQLRDSLARAGVRVKMATVDPPAEVRTFALTDLTWARAARAAARTAVVAERPRAILYSSVTAALLWPAPGAVRFDAPAAGNRPGRHGAWQRPLERRRVREATVLAPWSQGALAETPQPRAAAVVVPVPVAVGRPAPLERRDIAAVTYATNPHKKGLDRVAAAWGRARRGGERLLVLGISADHPAARAASEACAGEALTFVPFLPHAEYRALLRRARVFVTAPRREDYGLAQLDALAEGCSLVTTAAPGPHAALPIALALDERLVAADPGTRARGAEGLAEAIRTALDEPTDDLAQRAAALLQPYLPEAVDRVVAEELLPALLDR